MIEVATPRHALLKRDVGLWEASVKRFVRGPGEAPSVSKGRETNRLMEGGLWVLTDVRGEFAGRPFQGRGQPGDETK